VYMMHGMSGVSATELRGERKQSCQIERFAEPS
jgi:hypothetical protein